MFKKLTLLLMFALLLSVQTKPAQSHPHSWIDLETALLFDDTGMITGLWVGWLFDDFYSAFTLEGMRPGKDGKYNQTALDLLAKTNLENLSEYNYFTFLRADDSPLTYKPVTEYKTFVDNHRLWMEFTVELDKPIDPKKHKFDYAVYDPTYYVEILHAAQGDPIQFVGTGARGCNYALVKPEPPKELSLMAAALDKNETAGDGIGVSFAERVELSCQ